MECNYAKNLTRVDVSDPKGIMEPLTIGYVQNFDVSETGDVYEEATFDGYAVDTFKYFKTEIKITRLIRYNVEDEQKIANLLECMKTDPMTITFTTQKTSHDVVKNPVGKHVESYRNCRLADNNRSFKADDFAKQDLTFKSEGKINNTEVEEWSWFEGE